ncbi:hypothetical protein [Rhizobacter sp. Root404]|uniref:hypothetical protein n=1 Tax=Rhizobacter sp. Root404 TaxID=1736528 RepID=UPI000700253D|nr:hypothetical protein [Rhizobacter sp. Root404]KQW36545.1 hypothetical protein ASC76_17950 [Rhizobacter sp. Root404]
MHVEMLSGRTTINDFYGPNGFLVAIHRQPHDGAMLALIGALRDVPSSLSAYGMTHMHQLGLRAEDDERAPELVMLMASSMYGISIEYLLPEDEAPWPYAWVKGDTQSVDEAKEMVLTAMRRSGGWPGL